MKPSRPLETGDVLEFEIPPPRALVAHPEPIAFDIVFEDDDLLVVDKPAGMVTHPAHGATSGTLVNALLAHAQETLPGDLLRPGLVHRLDRDTSGLLVVAKREDRLHAFGRDESAPHHARVSRPGQRHTANPLGTIDGPIGRDPRNRLRFTIAPTANPPSRTTSFAKPFRRLRAALSPRYRRTHQIRVHLAAIGHPILNDPLYGKIEPRFELPGQALHAWRLAFRHPRTDEAMSFEAVPPAEYVQARVVS